MSELSMPKETHELLDVINGPVQKSGEYWQLAHNLMTSIPEAAMVHSADGEDKFWTTPSIRPLSHDTRQLIPSNMQEDPKATEIFSQRYAVAARRSGRHYNDDDELFLIVNGNYANPTLKFQANLDSLMVLDDFSSLADAHLYLPVILEAIGYEITVETNKRERDAKDSRHRRRIAASVGIGLLSLAGAGIGVAQYIKTGWADDARRARQAVVEFDKQSIDLETGPVAAGESHYIQPELSLFAQTIPKPQKQDSFTSPRSVSLKSTCTDVAQINPLTQEVKAATDGGDEDLLLVVSSAGVAKICYVGDHSILNFPHAAIQIVGKTP